MELLLIRFTMWSLQSTHVGVDKIEAKGWWE